MESGKSFKFNIEGIGRKISHKEQVEIIESFGIFPFSKNVDLKNPEIIFKIIENSEDHVIYFGTEVASNRVEEDTFHYKFDLKKRPYLGPTSTDHQLAFLMANQGQVSLGDFVYDPFVGTGSIVLACQYFNAFCFGGDLDIRVLKGYGVGRKTHNVVEGLEKIKKFDIYTNFYHYKMPVPEFFVMDCSNPAVHA